MFEYASSVLRAFRQPIEPSVRARLDAAWARVPASLRTPNQFLGRQYAGCGATIGAMPRCDFACQGCYLGEGANHVPALPVGEIRRQLRLLREWLGHGGNLQLTDGEITLRPPDELIEIVRYARDLGLVPMVMTHGDSFRRQPDLLPRLLQEGGLREVSIHIDTTQRGRKGGAYKHATEETALLPLRDEFARMIREVRRETGLPLDAATTYTVTRGNLAGVPVAMRWLRENPGVFKMISFQPAAQVGRTEQGLGGAVGVRELWAEIAEGLLGDRSRVDDLLAGEGYLGHPSCSRFVQGVLVRELDRAPVFHPLLRVGDRRDERAALALTSSLGGLTFRLDDRAHAIARMLGVALRAPHVLLRHLPALVAGWARRFDPADPIGFAWRWLRGEVQIDYLNVVSHHFMAADEIATAEGRERLNLCAFQVPIGDQLVSMCEVNALGVRDRHYAEIRGSQRSTDSPEPITPRAA